ncbi:methyltransferase [Dictyobacter sp. S3.2.2.5]|uniref:Methyltransferase n=1 Tax=Dictyobacter halimunensis TaxID=3026934 RepID=A0ABQ6FH61_9CHLR|nr:methyltransferase [Dictyobacter sp. S3.2.2.5]
MNDLQFYNSTFVDTAEALFSKEESIPEAMSMLSAQLQHLRTSLPVHAWKEYIVQEFRRHTLLTTLHNDPLSRRAYIKPRGYAGDAVMLDYIYSMDEGALPQDLRECTSSAQRMCASIVQADAGQAVCARKRLLAQKIDEVAEHVSHPHVLSLACGHLREAASSRAARTRRLGRFVAVDQDQESLKIVEQEFRPLGVETLRASVRDILMDRVVLNGFDFVYAAGLYDYLALPVAQRLTAQLFRMLNPGGRILLANFMPGITMAGYMEACMDWWLIYRDRAELLQCAQTLPEKQLAHLSLFADDYQNIVYLEITRKK